MEQIKRVGAFTALFVGSYLLQLITLLAVPFHVIYRSISKKYSLEYYVWQIALGNDVQAGSQLYGSKHTISAILGLRRAKGKLDGYILGSFVDAIAGMFGDKDHCRLQAIKEYGEDFANVDNS